MVHLGKRKIMMNKPIFAGMVIFDIAKTVVYEMHYNYIQKKFSSERAKLLFTDTDSLTYSIETGDIYEEMLPTWKIILTVVNTQKCMSCIVQ